MPESDRLMTDGAWSIARSKQIPNPIAEAMRWHLPEGDLIQVIERAMPQTGRR